MIRIDPVGFDADLAQCDAVLARRRQFGMPLGNAHDHADNNRTEDFEMGGRGCIDPIDENGHPFEVTR